MAFDFIKAKFKRRGRGIDKLAPTTPVDGESDRAKQLPTAGKELQQVAQRASESEDHTGHTTRPGARELMP